MSSRRRRIGGAAELRATDVCAKEMDRRFATKNRWNEVRTDPTVGLLKKSRAYYRKWNARRKLTNCLSRFDRRRRNAYNSEDRRQKSLLARLRPSLSQRASDGFTNVNKAVNRLSHLLHTANNKLSQVDVSNVKRLVSSGEGLLATAQGKIDGVDPEHINEAAKSFVSAADVFVKNKGNVVFPSLTTKWRGGKSVRSRKRQKNLVKRRIR